MKLQVSVASLVTGVGRIGGDRKRKEEGVGW